MNILGIISTKLVMERSDLLKDGRPKLINNEFGQTTVYLTKKTALILRHGNDSRKHILPHTINYRANIKALKDIGIKEIVGINSTGSLKKTLRPGNIVIPDDFLTLTTTPTIFQNNTVHITPALSKKVRANIIKAAQRIDLKVKQKGTYWQTQGPRLETKAEISMMSHFADIVGMTMANEAVIAQELETPYASACSIDNYGNGILAEPLNMKEILDGTSKNADLMIQLLHSYLDLFY
ncbi:MAG: MTAP family purine nucleoside phosphorylase [Smithella sp.]